MSDFIKINLIDGGFQVVRKEQINITHGTGDDMLYYVSITGIEEHSSVSPVVQISRKECIRICEELGVE